MTICVEWLRSSQGYAQGEVCGLDEVRATLLAEEGMVKILAHAPTDTAVKTPPQHRMADGKTAIQKGSQPKKHTP